MYLSRSLVVSFKNQTRCWLSSIQFSIKLAVVNMDKVDDGVFNFLSSCPAAPAGFQVASDF